MEETTLPYIGTQISMRNNITNKWYQYLDCNITKHVLVYEDLSLHIRGYKNIISVEFGRETIAQINNDTYSVKITTNAYTVNIRIDSCHIGCSLLSITLNEVGVEDCGSSLDLYLSETWRNKPLFLLGDISNRFRYHHLSNMSDKSDLRGIIDLSTRVDMYRLEDYFVYEYKNRYIRTSVCQDKDNAVCYCYVKGGTSAYYIISDDGLNLHVNGSLIRDGVFLHWGSEFLSRRLI